jgi:hypothetical protein
VATEQNAKRIGLLAALLVALAAVLVYQLRAGLMPGIAGGRRGQTKAASYTVPVLGWEGSEERRVPTPAALRDLFTYGAPPTPTPDPRPSPTPPPSLPPRPVATPTPDGIYLADGRYFPPPPRFPLQYVGWLGPDRLRIAVFREGDEVVAVPVGEKMKQVFILRAVGPTSVTIAYAGYPAEVTGTVPIVR